MKIYKISYIFMLMIVLSLLLAGCKTKPKDVCGIEDDCGATEPKYKYCEKIGDKYECKIDANIEYIMYFTKTYEYDIDILQSEIDNYIKVDQGIAPLFIAKVDGFVSDNELYQTLKKDYHFTNLPTMHVIRDGEIIYTADTLEKCKALLNAYLKENLVDSKVNVDLVKDLTPKATKFNENVEYILYMYKNGCPYCKAIAADYQDFIKNGKVLIFKGILNGFGKQGSDSYEQLKNQFDFSGTPTLHVVKNNKIIATAFVDDESKEIPKLLKDYSRQ